MPGCFDAATPARRAVVLSQSQQGAMMAYNAVPTSGPTPRARRLRARVAIGPSLDLKALAQRNRHISLQIVQ